MLYIKIPKNRLGVVIGKNGETKNNIEKKGMTKIEIDSKNAEAMIDESNAKDPFLALKTRDVIKAIARGFSPEKAMEIFNEDIYFEIIDIKEFIGRKASRLKVARGRLIGTNGKTREIIEEVSGSYISIYGHTISIIGGLYEMDSARTAVSMILNGKRHSTVYKYLEKRRREMDKTKLDMYETVNNWMA